jgi:hypothetical protein
VRIHSQDMAVCSLVCTVTAISVTQQCSRAATVGSEPSVRRRSSADPPRRCLRAHYCSARLSTPVAGHHYAARGTMTGLHAAGALYTVTRRAALKTGGLTVVSAYLFRVSRLGHTFYLGTPGPATALNAGWWAGDP